MLPITIKDVLSCLDKFNITRGFSGFTDEEVVSILDTNEPFLIKKSEWLRALQWGRDMPKRSCDDWWANFLELGYLVPAGDTVKEQSAWFQPELIRLDVEEFKGRTTKEYMEDDS